VRMVQLTGGASKRASRRGGVPGRLTARRGEAVGRTVGGPGSASAIPGEQETEADYRAWAVLPYWINPALAASAREAPFSQDVLYSGTAPSPRTKVAQAGTTRAAKP